MPVRIKQRPNGVEGRRRDGEQITALKRKLVGLVLAWGKPINLDLTSAHGPARLHLRVPPDHNRSPSTSSKQVDLAWIQRTLVHAGYSDPTARNSWTRISARTLEVSIQGAVCLKPAPSKAFQFVSLGIEPVDSQSYGHVFVSEVNRLFTMSSFGAQEDTYDAEAAELNNDERTRKMPNHTVRELRGHVKRIEKWPCFVIRIHVRDRNSSNMRKYEAFATDNVTLDKMVNLLRTTITKFLKDNNFKPRIRAQTRVNSAPTDVQASPQPCSRNPFYLGSRIKGGIREDVSSIQHWETTADPSMGICSSQLPVTDSVTGDRSLLGISQGSEVQDQLAMAVEETEPTYDASFIWHDPFTKAPVLINARTGFALQRKEARALVARNKDRVCGGSGEETGKVSVLQDWINPVFNPAEEAIPRVCYSDDLAKCIRHKSSCEGGDKDGTDGLSPFSAKLSKWGLKKAIVIAQVDQKFILVNLEIKAHRATTNEADAERILVLIDQHAADERIRIEDLLSELCASCHNLTAQSSIPRTLLPNAMVFQITLQERDLYENAQTYFANWGIEYDVNDNCQEESKPSKPPTPDSSCRLIVKSLPSLIAERCRKQPRVLIELLRAEIWDPSPRYVSANSECPAASSNAPTAIEDISGSSDTPPWLSKIHSMPRGLLDMLNSRACRSAVMFNDVLTLGECQALVSRLSDTRFPFQCAHGRPSVVPLVGVGGQERQHVDVRSDDGNDTSDVLGLSRVRTQAEGEGFLKAYRKDVKHREETIG